MAIDTRRIDEIATKYGMLTPMLDERQTRLWLAAEAKALGRGGIAAVTAATGIRDKRIRMGMRELAQMDGNPPPEPAHAQRIRREGGGRKQILSKDPTLLRDLESLIDPVTRGDPESPLRWTQLGRRFPWQRTPQNALDEAAARQV